MKSEAKQMKTSLENHYQKIDHFFASVTPKLSLSAYLTPINLTTERQNFFDHLDYSPQFIYQKIPIKNLNRIQARLSGISIPPTDHPLSIILNAKREELLKKIDLIKSIGTDNFPQLSARLFPLPKATLVSKAKETYRNPSPAKDTAPPLSKEVIIKWITNALKPTDIPHQINFVPDGSARIQVKPSSRGIKIIVCLSQGRAFTHSSLTGAIAHEIETHAFRYANGQRQLYNFFTYGTSQYLETEEGLAIYNREQVQPSRYRISSPSISVLAIMKAQTASFRATYNYLMGKGIVYPLAAFGLTFRVKRGLANTSLSGAFTRESIYLAGHLKIKSFVASGGDLRSLHLGKISPEDLAIIHNISSLKQPQYIPSYLTK